MIKRSSKGSFKNAKKYFKDAGDINSRFRSIMERGGYKGVEALSVFTPFDTGETAASWSYEVVPWGLVFYNSNIVTDVSVAVLLQFGHATKDGGYVQGLDYINPALRPIFNEIANNLRKEVINL